MRSPNLLFRLAFSEAGPLLFAGLLLLSAGCYRELPPFTTLDSGPERGVTGQILTFSARAFVRGDDSSDVALRFSWGDGDTSNWVEAAQRETVKVSHSWADSGHFIVKVQAKDEAGRRSDWLGGGLVMIYDSAIVGWVIQLERMGRTCAAVGPDRTVYVPTYQGLFAIRPDGTTKWSYTEFDHDKMPVVAADGTIYVPNDCYLAALNPDGTVRWRDTFSYYQLPPAVGVDGTIYSSNCDTALAIQPDGGVRWSAQLPGDAHGSPVVGSDGTVCYMVRGESAGVCAFDQSGLRRWAASAPYLEWLSAGDSGRFFGVGAQLSSIGADGSVLWTRQGANYQGEAVLDAGRRLFVPGEEALVVMDALSGEEKAWPYHLQVQLAVLIRSDGDIVVPCLEEEWNEGAQIVCLDSSLKARWVLDIDSDPMTAPGVAPDGTVYIGTSQGFLYAIKGAPLATDAPWPKFAHDSRNTGCAAGQ